MLLVTHSFHLSYALLTVMIAHVTGLKPGDFVHTLGWSKDVAKKVTKHVRTLLAFYIDPVDFLVGINGVC